MRALLLGSIDVVTGGRVTPIPGLRRRALLAALALRRGTVVDKDLLIHAVWNGDEPATAAATVQSHVSYLRSRLGDRDAIEYRDGGYRYAGATDVEEAERLIAAAAREPAPAEQATILRQALRLWRGPALTSLAGLSWFDQPAAWLAGLHERATALLMEARIGLGEHTQVLPELERLVRERPFDERLHGQLIMALYRAGRQVDALAAYERLRMSLGADLGVDPGLELRALQTAILRHDPVLQPPPTAPPAGRPSARTVPAAPAQLPASTSAFTGRQAEMARLDALLTAEPLVIAIVAGSAGAGKTAIAVRWAHRVRDRFPDGQLFADLRGWAAGPVVRPIDVLSGFLGALGVPREQIPVHLDQAAALYRTLLAGRRLMIVLDNAGSADQVRPLLPGEPGCLVLITSRDRLGGLVARDGAQPLPLAALDPGEAYDLLSRVLGERRVAAEPEQAAELARICGYLPLALRIAAAALLWRPDQPIGDGVDRLRSDLLGALTVDGDPEAGVAAAFDASYRALPAASRRLFRLLGLVPGREISTQAGQALAGPGAGESLDRLADAHLLEQTGGRWSQHDLLRAYAAERARREDSAADRALALGRLYDWYLAMVDAAAALLYPHMLRLPPTGDTPAVFADHQAAYGWLDTERADLVAAVRHAATADDDRLRRTAGRLADGLRGYFHLRRHVADWLTVAEAGLAAGTALGDLRVQAAARHSLGTAYRCVADPAAALQHYTEALRLARAAGWLEAEATTLGNLGIVRHGQGRLAAAVDHLTQALAADRRSGRSAGLANNLSNLAAVYLDLGRLPEAITHFAQALELFQRSGSRHGQALALTGLGRAYREQGRPDDAAICLAEALRHCAGIGDRDGLATAHVCLAAAERDRGEAAAADGHARVALALAREAADPRTEALALIALGAGEPDPGIAAGHYRNAYELAERAAVPRTQIEALIGLAETALAAGDHGQAHRQVQAALRRSEWSGYQVLSGIARLLAARGDAMAAAPGS